MFNIINTKEKAMDISKDIHSLLKDYPAIVLLEESNHADNENLYGVSDDDVNYQMNVYTR